MFLQIDSRSSWANSLKTARCISAAWGTPNMIVRVLALAVAGLSPLLLACFPNIALAQTIRPLPPTVYEIDVACGYADGQRYTVRIQSMKNGVTRFSDYSFNFRNVQGGATLSLSPAASNVPASAVIEGPMQYYNRQYQFFDIPAGVYDLTISHSPGSAQSSSLIVTNVSVPVAVTTNGRGTGCRFP